MLVTSIFHASAYFCASKFRRSTSPFLLFATSQFYQIDETYHPFISSVRTGETAAQECLRTDHVEDML